MCILKCKRVIEDHVKRAVPSSHCENFKDYHIEDVIVGKEYVLTRFTILEIYRNSDSFVAKVVDNETNKVCILTSLNYHGDDDLDEIKIGC